MLGNAKRIWLYNYKGFVLSYLAYDLDGHKTDHGLELSLGALAMQNGGRLKVNTSLFEKINNILVCTSLDGWQVDTVFVNTDLTADQGYKAIRVKTEHCSDDNTVYWGYDPHNSRADVVYISESSPNEIEEIGKHLKATSTDRKPIHCADPTFEMLMSKNSLSAWEREKLEKLMMEKGLLKPEPKSWIGRILDKWLP